MTLLKNPIPKEKNFKLELLWLLNTSPKITIPTAIPCLRFRASSRNIQPRMMAITGISLMQIEARDTEIILMP